MQIAQHVTLKTIYCLFLPQQWKSFQSWGSKTARTAAKTSLLTLCTANNRHAASSSPEEFRLIFVITDSQLSSGGVCGLRRSPISGTEAAWAWQGYQRRQSTMDTQLMGIQANPAVSSLAAFPMRWAWVNQAQAVCRQSSHMSPQALLKCAYTAALEPPGDWHFNVAFQQLFLWCSQLTILSLTAGISFALANKLWAAQHQSKTTCDHMHNLRKQTKMGAAQEQSPVLLLVVHQLDS